MWKVILALCAGLALGMQLSNSKGASEHHPNRNHGKQHKKRHASSMYSQVFDGNAFGVGLDFTDSTTVDVSDYEKSEGLITLYTDPKDATLLQLDLASIMPKNNSIVKLLASAHWSRGTYQDHLGQMTTLHEPVGNTIDTMLTFALSADGALVDVRQPRLTLRTSDEDSKVALSEGAWSGFQSSLARLKIAGDENAVLVDGAGLIVNGFFVSGWGLLKQIQSYRIVKVKSLPNNVLVTVAMQIDTGTDIVPVEISFSILALPEVPMAPRWSDDRLGFFTTDYIDVGGKIDESLSLPSEKVDNLVSAIVRFNTTANEGEEIRFHIDPTVPERWRSYFKEGVEAWNAAFALIGKPNTMRAILPGDEDWPADYDTDDARYSTISWSIDVGEGAYALGLAKIDPRSGEILKSDIIVTSGWVSAWLNDLERTTPEVVEISSSGFRRELHNFSKRPQSVLFGATETPVGMLPKFNDQPGDEHGTSIVSGGIKHMLPESQWEEAIGAGLRSVVMHETGHSLGLRHNFKASTAVDESCLRDPSCTSTTGLSASVMDYLPANLLALESPSGVIADLFMPVVGEYDKLAIQYGYMLSQDKKELDAVLVRAESMPLCSDEEHGIGEDPYCQVHDLGMHPLVYYRKRWNILKDECRTLLDRVEPGESYTKYGDEMINVINQAADIGVRLISYLGGVSVTRLHRGMTEDNATAHRTTSIVSKDLQLEAMRLLGEIVNSADALMPSEHDRKFLLARAETTAVKSLDIRKLFQKLQLYLLNQIMDAGVLERVHMSSGFDADALTVGELLDGIEAIVVGQGDRVPSLEDASRWDLQYRFIENLKNDYLQHCRKDVPVDLTGESLRRLRAIQATVAEVNMPTKKLLVNSSLRMTADMLLNEVSKADSYLTLITNELSGLDHPCHEPITYVVY